MRQATTDPTKPTRLPRFHPDAVLTVNTSSGEEFAGPLYRVPTPTVAGDTTPWPAFANCRTHLTDAEITALTARAETFAAERDEAHAQCRRLNRELDDTRRERDQALARLDLDAWDRITAERDQARQLAESLKDDLAAGDQVITAARKVADSDRLGSKALNALDDALAAYDAPAPSLGSPAARAQDAPEREEVRWAYRWIGTDGQVYDEMDSTGNAMETAEQRAHRIAAKRLTGTVRGEVIRYRVLTMPAEVVATYPAARTQDRAEQAEG